MTDHPKQTEYTPGFYGKKRPRMTDWVNANIQDWMQKASKRQSDAKRPFIATSVCFSRQIGSGALEIADHLAPIIGYRVVDREILEYMAMETRLTEKMIAFYDERYAGKMSELFSMLISEKTFLKSDYARQLAKTVTALCEAEPTIFVGRGAHLILPADYTLSVRIISSKEFRVGRVARMLNISMEEADKKLAVMDKEQADFFRSVFSQKEITPHEFDLIINRDHLKDAAGIARIVSVAFENKFGIQL